MTGSAAPEEDRVRRRGGGRSAARLLAAGLVATAAFAPADASAQAERCRGARAFLVEELAMIPVVEPDTIDDVRTGERLPGCRVTAAGLTARSTTGAARHVFERLREAGWVRTPDPLDSPGEASLRFRSGGADCLFTYVTGGLLDTGAALRADSLVVPGPGERRYNVLARCVPARPAAPGDPGDPGGGRRGTRTSRTGVVR